MQQQKQGRAQTESEQAHRHTSSASAVQFRAAGGTPNAARVDPDRATLGPIRDPLATGTERRLCMHLATGVRLYKLVLTSL